MREVHFEMQSMNLLGGWGNPQENFEKLDTQVCNFSVFYLKILTIVCLLYMYGYEHYALSHHAVNLANYVEDMMDILKMFHTFHKIQLPCNLHL